MSRLFVVTDFVRSFREILEEQHLTAWERNTSISEAVRHGYWLSQKPPTIRLHGYLPIWMAER